ncbi:MAG: ADP-glyceromanno-heptose 6-epimerase [Desulfobacteraceae bacterium]|nr:ADP-glyceromanno-heptose 6-epimerase [Desulfobacteraceae bacterium]
MLIVTGGAGFIGSNIVKELNNIGRTDIIVVDDLTQGEKFLNISDLKIHDYMDKDDFIEKLKNNHFDLKYIEAVFHEGACSDTTEWNGRFMMENNYEYSKSIFLKSIERNFQFIYASSASVYGDNTVFYEQEKNEKTLNVYAFSKLLFDNFVRRYLGKIKNQTAGLRYFNVYGPREFHKKTMASVAWHFYNQIKNDGVCRLFEGIDGYEDGGQKRDFVYVKDAVDVNIWLFKNPQISGIFNVGTGLAQTFNDVANAVIKYMGKGKIEYVGFPDHLKGRYQSYTQADITNLRKAGYSKEFKNVSHGVKDYLDTINAHKAS